MSEFDPHYGPHIWGMVSRRRVVVSKLDLQTSYYWVVRPLLTKCQIFAVWHLIVV